MSTSPAPVLIAVANQNGGVGKTTTAMNLGASLAESKDGVLLVDLDPQGTLTIAHGLDPDECQTTIYDALVQGADVRTPIVRTENGPDLIPANLDLAAAEVELMGRLARETTLKDVVAPLKRDYRFIIVDCPPSLGLLTINALVAADAVIVPVATQYLRFRGMKLLLDTLDQVKTKFNRELLPPRILPSMFQGRTVHSREVLEELRSTFGGQVFDTVIRHTVRLAEAPMSGRSILHFENASPHADAFRQLAEEVRSWLTPDGRNGRQ